MNTIKEMYEHPSLILCGIDKIPLTRLDTEDNQGNQSIYNLTLTEKMNECNQLSFSVTFDNDKIGYDDCENLILFEGKYYIIKNINVNDSDSRLIDVVCQEKCVELKGILCSIINVIGVSPLEMFNAIISSVKNPISDYIWKGTDVANDKYRSLQKDNECSVFENLLDMAKVFGGWLQFTSEPNGKTGIYLRKNAINNGKFVTKGRDLKQLNITYNSDEICTRMFGFGANDEITGQPINFMGVNPTGKPYVENYTYFLAKGLTIEQIATIPQCLQETTFTDDYMVDSTALMTETIEELAKVCVPKLSGSIDILDISVIEGSVQTKPQIGEIITTIDEDINFSISSQTESIERVYDKALEIKLGITNVIRYDSTLKNLTHSAEVVSEITSTSDNDGTTYVPVEVVKDSSGTSVKVSLNNLSSEITQQADEIALKVNEGDLGSLIEQHSTNVKVAFNGISDYVNITPDGLKLGNTNSNDYSLVNSQGLMHYDGVTGVPYHFHTQVGTEIFINSEDIESVVINLDAEFANTTPFGIASINKITKDGEQAMYWVASYITDINTVNMTATISGQANYRDLSTNVQGGGNITVSYLIVG